VFVEEGCNVADAGCPGVADHVGEHRLRGGDAVEDVADVVEDPGGDFGFSGLSGGGDELLLEFIAFLFRGDLLGDVAHDDGVVEIVGEEFDLGDAVVDGEFDARGGAGDGSFTDREVRALGDLPPVEGGDDFSDVEFDDAIFVDADHFETGEIAGDDFAVLLDGEDGIDGGVEDATDAGFAGLEFGGPVGDFDADVFVLEFLTGLLVGDAPFFGEGLSAGEEEEDDFEEDPASVFEEAPPFGVAITVDGFGEVVSTDEMIDSPDESGGDEDFPIPIEGEEGERAEDVEMGFDAATGEVDDHGRGEHLSDGDAVAGEDAAGIAKGKNDREERQETNVKKGREEFASC